MRVDRLLLATTVLTGLVLATESLGYVLHTANWSYQNNPIEEPFDLNTSSFPTGFGGGTVTQIEDRYTSAMDRWTYDSGADLVFLYGGRRNTTSWSNDNYNIGQFHPGPNGSALAVAQYWMSSGRIRDCDIRFYGSNSRGPINWSTSPNGPNSNQQDFERTATHELGHCLGLDHSSTRGAVMYSSQSTGTSLSARELHADDKAGAQAIYGAAVAPPPPPPPPPPPVDADLEITGYQLIEVGDGDGLFEPTERVKVVFTVDNLSSADAIDVEGFTTKTGNTVTMLTALSTPSLGSDILATSSDDLVGTEILIRDNCTEDHTVEFEVVVDADNAPPVAFDFEIDVSCGIEIDGSQSWRIGQAAWVEVQGALPGEEIVFERTLGVPARQRCLPRPGVRCAEDSFGRVEHRITADNQGVARWNFVVPANLRPNSAVWVVASTTRGDHNNVILKTAPLGRRVRP